MAEQKIIDGNLFKKMIINGTFYLKKNYQKINNLNVFPVPDGDTGTNMQMTMMEGVKKLQLINDSSIIQVSKVLSDALLMGSKGNSGVIFSQFFSGIYDYISSLKKNNINAEEFIDSMISGYKKSYSSIVEPVEGTILTVLRESIEETVKKKKEINTIKRALQIIIENAKISLSKTPDLLPILKQYKVVDSGGAGFICFLEGMLLFLDDVQLENDDITFLDLKVNHNIEKNSELKYKYCTEFIIKLNSSNDFDVEDQKQKMTNYGDSLILLKDSDLLKIHIHTNNPDNILTKLSKYGTLVKSKIENMKEQYHNFISKEKHKNDSKVSRYSVITFVSSSGKEIENTFKDLQSDIVLNLYKNFLSVEKLNKIINEINAEIIVIFPNQSDIIPIIKETCELNPKLKIEIIPTNDIVESYISLLVFDKNISLQKNLTNMKNYMQKIQIGKIIDSRYLENKIDHKLDLDCFVSYMKNKIIENNKDLILLTKNLLKKMISKKNNFLTIFYHKQTFLKRNLEKIESFVEEHFPNLEIEKIENNNSQKYPYIFVLE
ncbi:DAK2 domain-containing protein [Columbia Basin potato purple top phytoplasma]|uniref:DAK2 domain-containing protein n=1 Tax=Columbia Basin potato purple top phytoplasma TaxID=307134 RepID=A0ABT5L937_9MOLU|nr:DAK2 domain-containing protein [Columbia Basin potato purple top phytoplasma]MDC9032122.1 DAK2 domain-containing protein [Columbia Basin potato purple top phytoplasma]